MMIWFAAENGHGAVELLDGEQANHLVGKSHAAERKLAVGTLIDRLAKTVRTTNNERQVAT